MREKGQGGEDGLLVRARNGAAPAMALVGAGEVVLDEEACWLAASGGRGDLDRGRSH